MPDSVAKAQDRIIDILNGHEIAPYEAASLLSAMACGICENYMGPDEIRAFAAAMRLVADRLDAIADRPAPGVH
jgi:hypothetical protein